MLQDDLEVVSRYSCTPSQELFTLWKGGAMRPELHYVVLKAAYLCGPDPRLDTLILAIIFDNINDSTYKDISAKVLETHVGYLTGPRGGKKVSLNAIEDSS
jgi:hypothetical protein